MRTVLGAFAADESGVTAIEYGAIVMFVGLALVLALEGIGMNLESTFKTLQSVFGAAAPAASG